MPITADVARYFAAFVSEVSMRAGSVLSGDLVARLTGANGAPYEAFRFRGSDRKIVLPGGIELAWPSAGSGTIARLEDITGGAGLILAPLDNSGFDGVETHFTGIVPAAPNMAYRAMIFMQGVGPVFQVAGPATPKGTFALSGVGNRDIDFGIAPKAGALADVLYLPS